MIPETKLRQRLQTEGVDVLVAASPQNVFYLSGLQSLSQDLLGERAFALRTADGRGPRIVLPAVDASIVVDTDLDYEQVYTYGSFYLYEGDNVSDADRDVLALKNERNYDGPIEALRAALDPSTDGASTVALEQTGITPDERDAVAAADGVGELRTADDIYADLRRVKSDEEVRRLRRSVSINQESIMAAVSGVEEGMTEQELASIYQRNLVSRGAEPLFTVVGFGSHGAYPHAVPGDRRLREGDLVRFDVGCTYENYSSDIARTFAFRSTDDALERKYEVLNGSMNRSIELLEDGVTTREVFDDALAYVRERGADVFDSFDRNHFGHGIGIDVYDPPTIDRDRNRISAGMVLCIEPPYYELGTGGIQVEDEVLVTEDGAERFSECPQSLEIIG